MEFLLPVWDFVKARYIVSAVLAVVLVLFIVPLVRSLSIHVWYGIVLVAAGAAARWFGLPLYFWPFALGMATAFAEIISKSATSL